MLRNSYMALVPLLNNKVHWKKAKVLNEGAVGTVVESWIFKIVDNT